MTRLKQAIEAVAAPPALPEDVRETLLDGLHYASIWYENNRINARLEAELIAIEAARAWLESAPVASDKAVCPKCGESKHCEIYHAKGLAFCMSCVWQFTVQVLVISPPREPKVTP